MKTKTGSTLKTPCFIETGFSKTRHIGNRTKRNPVHFDLHQLNNKRHPNVVHHKTRSPSQDIRTSLLPALLPALAAKTSSLTSNPDATSDLLFVSVAEPASLGS